MNKTALLAELRKDAEFRNDFVKELICDKEFVKELAVVVLGLSCEELGMPVPGTLGESLLRSVRPTCTCQGKSGGR